MSAAKDPVAHSLVTEYVVEGERLKKIVNFDVISKEHLAEKKRGEDLLLEGEAIESRDKLEAKQKFMAGSRQLMLLKVELERKHGNEHPILPQLKRKAESYIARAESIDEEIQKQRRRGRSRSRGSPRRGAKGRTAADLLVPKAHARQTLKSA